MKKIWEIAILVALAGGMSGCLDDDNNYNYSPVNELKGGTQNFGNFKTDYSVIEGEELKLAPTFQFTIDEVPDVSYEWYVDQKLQSGETGETFVFKSDKSGKYEVTFAVIDNKSGVKFGMSTFVRVRSIYQRGWCILSDEGGRSALHFIVPTTYTYETMYNGKKVLRDSLVYHDVRKDILPDLGTNPMGLMEHIGELDYHDDFGIEIYDELVVKQDKWVELNGNTLEREVYTYQEFRDDPPVNFKPKEAAMTYSAKAILDENGLIYWMNKGDIADFHAGFYTSVGLNNNQQFSRLFQANKLNRNHCAVVLALRAEDNSLVGIYNGGEANYRVTGTTITENSQSMCGTVYEIEGKGNFKEIDKEVVDALPAAYDVSYWGYDVANVTCGWLTLLKDKGSNNYDLRYFLLDGNKYGVNCDFYYEYPNITISDYRGMAVFANRHYAVIADGSQLYYFQYFEDNDTGTPASAKMMPLGNAFASPVKALHGLDLMGEDINDDPYCGQLGVALEDGSFYIFGVHEDLNGSGVCNGVSRKQLFPDENTSEKNKNFGKVVDVIYKLGRGMDYTSFAF